MTKTADSSVPAAKRRAALAQAQLVATATNLRDRLKPRSLAAEGAQAVAARANNLAYAARGSVSARPMVTGASLLAFVAAVGLRVWLARRNNRDDNATVGDVDGFDTHNPEKRTI